jgi:hypothetical protein
LEVQVMTGLEVVGLFTITVVGALAVGALFLGLANWVGAFYMVHCRRCHHLTGSNRDQPVDTCVHCRHPVLTHPLYALAHRTAPIQVRPDPLHY